MTGHPPPSEPQPPASRLSGAAEYVRTLSVLVERLPVDSASGSVECRPFFGGAAAYAGGRIFATLSAAGLAVKVPDLERDRLIGSGAGAELRYFPRGHVKRGYVVFQHWGADPDTAAAGLQAALRHVAGGGTAV